MRGTELRSPNPLQSIVFGYFFLSFSPEIFQNPLLSYATLFGIEKIYKIIFYNSLQNSVGKCENIEFAQFSKFQ